MTQNTSVSFKNSEIVNDFLEIIQSNYEKVENSIKEEINLHKCCNISDENINQHKYCNLSGEPIKDERIICYKSGEIYLWKYFEKYINYLIDCWKFSVDKKLPYKYILKGTNSLKKEQDGDIQNKECCIEFDLTFTTSFHHYIKTPYDINTIKYLIYGTYSFPFNTKPYFTSKKLKVIKEYFKHGDIVSTGEHHYIMKSIKMKKKIWKKIDYITYNDDYEIIQQENEPLIIEFQYVMARGFSHYISLSNYFNIKELPMDDKKEDYFNIRDKYIYSSDENKYVDDIPEQDKKSNPYMDVNNDENEDLSKGDEINNEYGRVIIKNKKFYIMYDDKQHIELTENIARQFIYIRGYTYYYNICREYGEVWKCLISPLEVINLGTMEISKVKIEL